MRPAKRACDGLVHRAFSFLAFRKSALAAVQDQSHAMSKRLAVLSFALLAAGVAQADDRFIYATPKDHPTMGQIVKGGGCAPKDNTVRVLKSAHPLDYAPNWTGDNYVGMAWIFMPKRYVVHPDMKGGIYLEGHLITPRAAEMPDDLFILFAEWHCPIKS